MNTLTGSGSRPKRTGARTERQSPPRSTPAAKQSGGKTQHHRFISLLLARAENKNQEFERFAGASIDFSDVYRMGALERINLIQQGIEPTVFKLMAQQLRRSKESFGDLMGLPVTTVDRKIARHERLSIDQSERLVSAAKLIGQIQSMIEESGDPEGFDAAQWFDQWLDKPLAALGGRTPSEFMSTAEGRELLSRLLATAQSGAYA